MASCGTSPETILNYWHKIEFFESTSIDELQDGAKGVIRYSQEMLNNIPDCLPWLNRQNIRRAAHAYLPDAEYSYVLYLGIFPRREIFARAKAVFPEAEQGHEEQRDDEGLSCSIKIHVGSNGQVDLSRAEFSTVPWSLGQLQSGQLDRITWSGFEQDTDILRQALQRIVTVAGNIKQEHGLPQVLTTHEVIEFLKSLSVWTAFSPASDTSLPALIVQASKLSSPKKSTERAVTEVAAERLSRLSALPSRLGDAMAGSPSGGMPGDMALQGEINIFNSFYIRDIEQVIAQVRQSGLSPESPLGRYLSTQTERKPDLLTAAGRSLLIEQLRLSKLPAGRWPGEDSEFMSLMQQFAINTLESELADTGLYSVNGPPGTGKTTMLRDLVASNLVKRATVLASLPQASDAFAPDIHAAINGKVEQIKCLIPALTGFEMVVVSNNNTAVENISRELPQIRRLGRAYRDMAYLKPVAQKLAAKHLAPPPGSGKKTKVSPLEEYEDCWGLIAAALGKSANRSMFCERLLYKPIDQCEAGAPADTYQTLVAAIWQQAGDGNVTGRFQQAKADFLAARHKVKQLMTELERLESLAMLESRREAQQAHVHQAELQLARRDVRIALSLVRKPGFGSGRFRRWCRWRAIHAGLGRRREFDAAKLVRERHTLQTLEAQCASEQQACAPLLAAHAEAVFPYHATDMEQPAIQRKAFGQCLALNQARAELTVKALALHQAWLAAACKTSGLSRSVYCLGAAIDGKVPDPGAALALWQLLFMIVPVVSSTFASVARQFRHFAHGEIGWLFIDEAGQATPQQAVGALWRAQRAVVVGDPLQLEPVFTIPPAFVETFARHEFGADWLLWSPSVNSVQGLADRANPYGTWQIADDKWLGSPLRVHRRCNDPMFSIANAIAYNNKMLHGSDTPRGKDATFIWKHSDWFDIVGNVEQQHFVPAQADFVLDMIREHIRQHGTLPDVYIISPFKRVKAGMAAALRRAFGKQQFAGTDFSKWVCERVGTVHTFQGKEEENVILLLGLDQDNPGAARWASAKPNLLNVAVTRARKRLYVVGSKKIWSGCRYFAEAEFMLEQAKQAALREGR